MGTLAKPIDVVTVLLDGKVQSLKK